MFLAPYLRNVSLRFTPVAHFREAFIYLRLMSSAKRGRFSNLLLMFRMAFAWSEVVGPVLINDEHQSSSAGDRDLKVADLSELTMVKLRLEFDHELWRNHKDLAFKATGALLISLVFLL